MSDRRLTMARRRRTLDHLTDQLHAVGLRRTAPRVAVLDLLARAGGPLSHGEVAAELAERGFDRATVYRNLLDLTDVELVRRTDPGDHVWRFELVRDGAA